jgi:SWI/SNF-related matrix-associated actin-dependent regulator of chromatin subfamily A-like protein 1
MPRPTTPLSLKHQIEGTKFLRDNERAALFDEQGLGKSKQLIDAVSAEVANGSMQGALIVCPNGLKSNWADEIRKFSNLPCSVFGSGRTARRSTFRNMRSAFFVINYEAVPAELPSLKALLQFKPMALVLDEAHRIKTPDAKITKAVHLLRKYAKRRYILTGTPVANKPDDLWSQMYFLDDGESLGETFQAFQKRYRSGRSGYKNVDDLREQIAIRSLRRTKDTALQLPPKTFHRISVQLAPRQRDMYEEMRAELALWVRSMSGAEVLERAEAILARMIRLAQLASNPGLLDAGYRESPAKFSALDDLLARFLADANRKTIVWTSFVENIDSLQKRYADYRPVVIHGDVDSAARDRAVRAFKTNRQVRLLIANPAAAREGLTLTEADTAIYVDRTFNLVDYLQSQDRIHRISQTRPCEIVLLIASGTVDEFIDFSIEQKHRLARFAQRDVATVSSEDLELRKPDVLRALLSAPSGGGLRNRAALNGKRPAVPR